MIYKESEPKPDMNQEPVTPPETVNDDKDQKRACIQAIVNLLDPVANQ